MSHPTWTSHRVGPLVTKRVAVHPDGGHVVATSRRHRKGLAPQRLAGPALSAPHRTGRSAWRRFWAPRRSSWWIAVLFIVGSALFTAGGFATTWPSRTPAALVSSSGAVFFIGSLFFTAAAALQWLEAINADVNQVGQRSARWRWFAWRPTNAGYLSSLTQLIGTLLFNVNTADAMIANLGSVEADVLVWTPNVLGSVCFLVSSGLGYCEVSHGSWRAEPRSATWWVVATGVLGSVAFGVSAAFSFVGSDADAERQLVASGATFVGAVFFLASSYLLLPEMFDGEARPTTHPPRR